MWSDLFEKRISKNSLLILNPRNTRWCVLENKAEIEDYKKAKKGDKNKIFYFLTKKGIISDNPSKTIKNLNRVCSGENLLCVMHTTGKCNLACKYCYENGTKNEESFNEETSLYLVDYLLNSKFKKITLVFHGGEPLLEFGVIKKTIEYAKSKDKNKRFSFSIQTNGTLITKRIIEFCKANSVSIGISIDGYEEVHDCFRVNKGGKGSLKLILNSIKLLKKNRKSFGVLSVVSKRHIGNENKLLKFFVNNGIMSFRLNPLFSPRESDMRSEALTSSQYFKFMRNIFEEVLDYRKKGIKIKCLDITDLLGNICTEDRGFRCLRNDCGAGFTFLGVNPRGDVFPCGEFINIYSFKQGSIFKDSIEKLQLSAISKKLRSRRVESQEDCNICPFRNICGGGCPGKSFFIKGDIRAKNPLCSYYKKMIPYLIVKCKEDPSILDMIKKDYFRGVNR